MELKIPSKIELSRKDKEKGISLPTRITEDLAYICGVLIGDGHIHYRKEKGDYCIKCVGHPIDEKEFYDKTIVNLLEKYLD